MATKMKLVPEHWINNFKSSSSEKMQELQLPKSISQKGNEIWKKIQSRASIDAQHRIVYRDGQNGSPLVDLLQYFILPSSSSRPRPYDSDRFLSLLLETGVPQTVVDSRFFDLFNHEDINNRHETPKLSAWQAY